MFTYCVCIFSYSCTGKNVIYEISLSLNHFSLLYGNIKKDFTKICFPLGAHFLQQHCFLCYYIDHFSVYHAMYDSPRLTYLRIVYSSLLSPKGSTSWLAKVTITIIIVLIYILCQSLCLFLSLSVGACFCICVCVNTWAIFISRNK